MNQQAHTVALPSATGRPIRMLEALAAACAAGMAVVWLWACWCIFPLRSWNDIRLAPTFGLSLGLPLYGGEDGPASTWMYGPLPVWINWPATWAPGPGEALLVAGAINILLQLAAIVAVCAWWPVARFPAPGAGNRIVAAGFVVAVWPWASWQFFQADNPAIACGLLANLLLVRGRGGPTAWMAATLATAAVMCKQTSLAVPVAQVVWVAATAGGRSATNHAARLAMTGAAWLALAAAAIEPSRMWYSAVLVPGGLPWTDRPGERLLDMAPYFAVHALAPLAVWLWLGRARGTADLSLPTLVWLLAWPLGTASVFKTGGTNNCLQGFPLWLPAAVVVVLAAAVARAGRGRVMLTVATVTALLLGARIATRPVKIWTPTIDGYTEAVELSRRLPGMLWFPWNPLVTVHTERRMYQTEDGLYIRQVVGRPIPDAVSKRHLPPRLAGRVLPSSGSEWGLAARFLPEPVERIDLENWVVLRQRPTQPGEKP